MNQERLLEFAGGRLLSLGLDSINSGTIVLPNRRFTSEGVPLWIELSISAGSLINWTETESLRVVLLSHLICVPANSETARANNIASKIIELYNSFRGNYRFQISANVLATVSDTEQLGGMVDENVYSTNVRITFDLYENMEIV
jgi:hypothetical protein